MLHAQSGYSAQLARVNVTQVNASQIKVLAQAVQQDAHLTGQLDVHGRLIVSSILKLNAQRPLNWISRRYVSKTSVKRQRLDASLKATVRAQLKIARQHTRRNATTFCTLIRSRAQQKECPVRLAMSQAVQHHILSSALMVFVSVIKFTVHQYRHRSTTQRGATHLAHRPQKIYCSRAQMAHVYRVQMNACQSMIVN